MTHATATVQRPLEDDWQPPEWAAASWHHMKQTHPEHLAGLRKWIEEIVDAHEAVAARVDASDVQLPDPDDWPTEILLRLDAGDLQITMSYGIRIPIRDVIPGDVVGCETWEDWALDQSEWIGSDHLHKFLRHIELLENDSIEADLHYLAEQALRQRIEWARHRHLSMRAGRGNRLGPRPEDTCCKTPEWLVKLRVEAMEAEQGPWGVEEQ